MVLFLVVFFSWTIQAEMYLPGETLEPACAPTDIDCGILVEYITLESLSSLIPELNYDNTNGVFSLESGYNIPLTTAIANWDTAFGWGNHASAGYLTSFTETDPVYSAWDKSTGISITESQISDLQSYLTSYTETDPIYSGSTWFSTTNNATNWDTAFGWGNHASAGYLTLPALTSGSILFSNGTTLAQNNAQFFWDSVNNRLGVGTSSPTETFSLVGNMAMTGDIVPTVNDTYALGSLTHVWKDLFVGAGSIYVNGQKVLQTDPTDSVVVSADDAQNLILKTTGGGNIELNPAAGGGTILLKSNAVLTAGKTLRTSDLSAVNFSDGTQSGNIKIAGNSISSVNTNGGIEIVPNGLGGTYITNGNVGIGTTSGLSKLSINGGLHVGGDSDAGDNNILADGTITGSNLSGTNTGDETTNTLKTKLGVASAGIDGYLSGTDWSTFNNKLDAFSEIDPFFTAWDKSTGISITESQISNLQSYLLTESDTLQSVTDRGATTTKSIEALSFIKTGGVSTEFLKGDGSVDSSTYLTSISGLDHNSLGNLAVGDVHTQYALLAGRTGGQTIKGGSAMTDILTLIGTAGNGTLTSPAVQVKVGNNGATTAITVLNNSNVGIGTTNPNGKLDLVTSSATTYPTYLGDTSAYPFYLRNSNTTTGTAALIALGNGTDSYTSYIGAEKTTNSSDLVFGGRPTAGGTFVERMRITSGGNLGIGTTTPTSKLTVNGTISTIAGSGGNLLFGTTLPSRYTNSAAYPGIFVGNGSNSALIGETTAGYRGMGIYANIVRDTALGWVHQDTTQPGWIMGLNYETAYTDAWSVFRSPSGTAGAAAFNTLLTVKGSGNVGIGTTTPSSLLTISSGNTQSAGTPTTITYGLNGYSVPSNINTTASGDKIAMWNTSGYKGAWGLGTGGTMWFQSTGDGSAGGLGNIQFYGGRASAPVETMTILGSGNVGIGTTNPSTAKLEILSTLTNAIPNGLKITSTGSGSEASPQYGASINLNAGYTGSAGTYGFGALNASAGTGTTWISGTDGFSYRPGSGNTGGFGIAANGATTATGFRLGLLGTAGNGAYNIGTLGSATVDKASTLNVGVAGFALNSNATAPVAVGGYFSLFRGTAFPTITDTAALIANNGTQTSPIFLAQDNGTNVFSIIDGGNVGIGTASPSARLHTISTTEQLRVGYDASNYFNATVGSTGLTTFNAVGAGSKFVFSDATQFSSVGSGAYAYDLNLTSDGTLTTSASDIALKQNILTIDGAETLAKIMRLKPSSFDWKSNGSHDIGLIAQEVELIFPELVFTNPTDGYKGINYSRLPTILVSALQEQQQQIAALKTSDVTGVSTSTLNDGIISGGLEVTGHVTLGRDTIGEATIPSGMTEVAVVFEKTYMHHPVITISKNTQGPLSDYYIDEISNNGFKIKIDTPQNKDFVFSWHAFGTKNIFSTSPDPVPEVPSCHTPQVLVDNNCVDPNTTLPTVDVPTCQIPQILVDNVCVDPVPTEDPVTQVQAVPEVPSCESPQILVDNVCTNPTPSEAPVDDISGAISDAPAP